MILRLGLLIIALSAPITGQSRGSPLPDTTRIHLEPTSLAYFPLWAPPTVTGMPTAPDSLSAPLPPRLSRTSRFMKRQRWLGAGLTVVFGALSWHYQLKAEEAYREYRTSGKPAELDRLFHETQRMDRLAGWCYAGAETGLLLVVLSAVWTP